MIVTASSQPAAAPLGILLVDDQPAMLRGLQMLIDGESPRMEVVGLATGRDAALQIAGRAQPDVILLDLDLAGESSLDFLPELLSRSAARVLIFTGVRDPAMHRRALRDGAVGVVMKEETAEVLLQAISRAHLDRGDERPLAAPLNPNP